MLYRLPTTRPLQRPFGRSSVVAQQLRALARHFAEWRLRRDTAVRLRDLDDRLLADIGISRHEINARARRDLNGL
jgi:uncharacterized protein YjiS (DUF1127 family)